MADEITNSNTATVDAPDKGAIAAADAHSEAEQDAVLSRILAGDESAGEAKPKSSGTARDEQGRFSPSSKDAAKPEAKQDSKPEASAEQAPAGVKPDDYRKALKALEFDGVSQKVLDAMDPAEIVAWGLKRAKNHADVQRLKADHEALKAREPAAKQSEPAKVEPIDMAKLVEPVAKKFSEETGVDMAGPLAEMSKQLLEAATAGLQAKIAEQQQVIDSIQGSVKRDQREAARAKLSEKYDLGQDDRWQRVLDHCAEDRNEYASEHERVQAACRYQFADEIISGYESKLKDQHKMRDKGQSTTQHSKTPPKAKTQDDVDDQILGHILDGNTEAAMRLGRRSHRSDTEMMAAG